jgi:hypothetical protein
MSLYWYYYLSWWFFIWFILYQLKIIPYSPYLAYIFVFTYIIIKLTTEFIHYTSIDKKEIKNYDTLFAWLLIVFIIDIMPFLYLEKEINTESTIFTIIVLSVYTLFMKSMNVDIMRLYTTVSYRKLTDKYSLVSLIKCIFVG